MSRTYTLLLFFSYCIAIGLCEHFDLDFLAFCLKMLRQYPDTIRLCFFTAKLHILYIVAKLKELFQ